jgi:hypothetical protein
METIQQSTNRKDDKISRAIDKVLNQVFGQEATQLIYKHLEHNYSLKHDEISKKIDVFAQGLEEFLRSGAYVVEKRILQDIYSNYGLLHRLECENVGDERDFVSQMKVVMHKA